MSKVIQFPAGPVDIDSSRWNLPNGVQARFGHGNVNDVALSRDGRYLAVAGDVGVWFYDLYVRSLVTMWDKGQAPYSSLTFSYDSQLIAIADSRGVVGVFNVSDCTCLAELVRNPNRGISELVFSTDSQYLAAGGGRCHENDGFSVDVWWFSKSSNGTSAPLLLERNRAYEGTTPFAFSANNRLLACATSAPDRCISPSEEGNISVWDVETHERVACLMGLPHFVASLDFSPCGRLLAAGDWSGTVHVWEITSGCLHRVYPSCGQYYMLVSYSRAGTLYAAGVSRDDNTIIVWGMEQTETCYTSTEHSRYFPTCFSGATRLAFGSQNDFHVHTFGVFEHRKIRHLHVGQISKGLLFSPDEKTLLSIGPDGVFLWTVTNPQQPPQVFKPILGTAQSPSEMVYFSLEVSSDGKHFTTSASENILGLWEMGNSTPIAIFAIQAEVKNAAFAPTTNLLACRDTDDRIYLWDVISESLCYTYDGEHTLDVQLLVFSPNGEYLLSNPNLLYDVVRRERIQGLQSEIIQYYAFSPCSRLIAGAKSDAILLWDIQQGKVVLSLSKPQAWEQLNIETLVFSPCGRYLAGSPEESHHVDTVQLQVWSIHSGEPIAVFNVPSATQCLAFSPDGTLLASASYDGTILLWDMKQVIGS